MSNYGNYFSDPAEMEKYKEKVRLHNKYRDLLPDANLYPNDYYEFPVVELLSVVSLCTSNYPIRDDKYIRFQKINVNGPDGIFKQWEATV